MQPRLLMAGGLMLALAACASSGPSPVARTPAAAPGTPTTAGTGQMQGETSNPTQPGVGVPSAGTGTIMPRDGSSSQPPRPGVGRPSARSSTVVPIQGQEDRGPGAR